MQNRGTSSVNVKVSGMFLTEQLQDVEQESISKTYREREREGNIHTEKAALERTLFWCPSFMSIVLCDSLPMQDDVKDEVPYSELMRDLCSR